MLCYIVNIPLLHKLGGGEKSSFFICQLSERGFSSIYCHLGLHIRLSTHHGIHVYLQGSSICHWGIYILFRDC